MTWVTAWFVGASSGRDTVEYARLIIARILRCVRVRDDSCVKLDLAYPERDLQDKLPMAVIP
jgi:hypothetical protein